MAEHAILVVDDEQAQRTVLAGFLRKRGFEEFQAASVEEGLAVVRARTVDLVLTDLRMPGGGGLALLEGVRALNPEIPVIVMTAFGTVSSAVDAMKKGAADYLTKPIDLDELEVLIGRTLERRALVAENQALRQQLETRYRLAGLETSNPRMAEAINTAARAAGSRATVLIRGESGTGKELLARAIHYASPRARGPLIAVNWRHCPRPSSSRSSSGTSAARSRARTASIADGSSWPTAGRCSWTRSAICRRPRRPSCCACCRNRRSSDWAAPGRSGSTCACWPPPTAISRRWSSRASSAKTSTTA